MAKLNANKPDAKNKKNPERPQRDTRWITADIRSKEHEPALRAQYADVGDTLDKFVMLVDQSFEIAIKPNDKGSGAVAYLFAPHHDGYAVRRALSANGKDAYFALVSLVYKYFTVLDGEWGEDDASDTSDFG